MTVGKPQIATGQGFRCPGCGQRASFIGSRYRAGRIRVCAPCFVSGRVAPPEPVREAVKVTVLPGFDGVDRRYQVAPGERILGGFATLGVGKYLGGETA